MNIQQEYIDLFLELGKKNTMHFIREMVDIQKKLNNEIEDVMEYNGTLLCCEITFLSMIIGMIIQKRKMDIENEIEIDTYFDLLKKYAIQMAGGLKILSPKMN